MRWVPWIFLASIILFAATAAPAHADHPRNGRVMYVISADEPAVVVRSDAVWAPTGGTAEEPTSICGRRRCARVARVDSCEPPACPGGGRLLIAERDLADVDDFPEGLEDWTAEIESMQQDPALAQVVGGYRGSHPDDGRAPDGWRNDDHEGLEWELGYGPSIATTSDLWQTGVGGMVSLGFRFALDMDAWDDDIDDLFETMFGDTYGADLRVRVWRGGAEAEQGTGWMYTVGVAPVIFNAMGEGRLRVPAIPYGIAVPELGVVVRDDRERASFYVGWSVPVSLLVTDDFGLELRGTAFLVDGWAPEDDEAEWLLSAEITALMR